MKNIWQKAGLLIVYLLLTSAAPVQQSYLYILTQQENKGDRNAALGIADAIQELNPGFERCEFENKNKKLFLQAVKQNLVDKPCNKGIIIAVGDYSIGTLKDLKTHANVVIVHASHQWTQKHKDLDNVATFVALPKHTLTSEIENCMSNAKLIPTIGVAHNLTREQIRKEYAEHKDQLPQTNKYIGVILGGDAPSADGTMQYYTQEEAKQLADYLAGLVKWRKVHLLILNGPRTGKYNPQTQQELKKSHRDGFVDPVTSAFVTELEKRKLIKGKDFTLFDFQFDQPSLQKAVLGALMITKSPLYVAGESTSSISEAVTTLPGLVTVFTNNAMNPNHEAHVISEQESGHVNVLSNQGGKWILRKAASQKSSPIYPSATQAIAEIVVKQFQEIPSTIQK